MFTEILLETSTEYFENRRMCSVPWYKEVYFGLKRTIYKIKQTRISGK